MWSFHVVAFLFCFTAAIPMANGFAPSTCLAATKVVHYRWWVGPETIVKTQLMQATSSSWANDVNGEGETPLHQACRMTSPGSVVKILLDRGADPNVQDRFGRTPLFIACNLAEPQESTIQLLLERGANPDIADKSGNTPLHKSLSKDAIVKVLLKHGADPMVPNKKGRTPLQDAIAYAIKNEKDSSIVELLLTSQRDETPPL